MGKYDAVAELLAQFIAENSHVKIGYGNTTIPVGISNRHLHLSEQDLETLFGAGYQLTNIKKLSQLADFACKETVTLAGPRGAIEKIRIIGPVRAESQVEILQADTFKLGITTPVRVSGDLADTPGVTIVGPKGTVLLQKGLIVAQRHIHMAPEDAQRFGVSHGDVVLIKVDGMRGGVLGNVPIRITPGTQLDCHLDAEEANAMGLTGKSRITIVK